MEPIMEDVRLGSTYKEEKGLTERQWGVEVGAQACLLLTPISSKLGFFHIAEIDFSNVNHRAQFTSTI